MKESRVGIRIAILFLPLVIVASAVLLLGDHEQGGSKAPAAPHGEGDYPDAWRTTLDGAKAKIDFALVLPDDPLANESNLTDVFAWPEGHAVALRFPAPGPGIDDSIRQTYIEVFETPWRGGDPAAAWAEDVAKSGIEGETTFDIKAIPALGVVAHSPTDIEKANPAFLRFVYGGLDIQVSGGDDLNALIRIATSMIR